MAIIRPARNLAGSLASKVSHLVNLGRSLSRIKELVKKDKHLKNTSNVNIEKAFQFQRQTRTSAGGLRLAYNQKNLSSLKAPCRRAKCEVLRITVTGSFLKPGQAKPAGISYTIDVDRNITKEDLLALLRKTVIDDLAKNYELRKGGRGGLYGRLSDLFITQIEGL